MINLIKTLNLTKQENIVWYSLQDAMSERWIIVGGGYMMDKNNTNLFSFQAESCFLS